MWPTQGWALPLHYLIKPTFILRTMIQFPDGEPEPSPRRIKNVPMAHSSQVAEPYLNPGLPDSNLCFFHSAIFLPLLLFPLLGHIFFWNVLYFITM